MRTQLCRSIADNLHSPELYPCRQTLQHFIPGTVVNHLKILTSSKRTSWVPCIHRRSFAMTMPTMEAPHRSNTMRRVNLLVHIRSKARKIPIFKDGLAHLKLPLADRAESTIMVRSLRRSSTMSTTLTAFWLTTKDGSRMLRLACDRNEFAPAELQRQRERNFRSVREQPLQLQLHLHRHWLSS